MLTMVMERDAKTDPWERIPAPVWRLFDATEKLLLAVREGSREWSCPVVELHLWDYSYCPNAGIEWPEHWPDTREQQVAGPIIPLAPPGPGHLKVYRQEDKPIMCVEKTASTQGRAFSVFLLATETPLVDKITERLRTEDRQCVVFERGIKYAAIKRVPLPGEQFWLGPNCPSSRIPPSILDTVLEPILVLECPDPWAMVLGSGAPALVVYRNGLAILGGSRCITFDETNSAQWTQLLGMLHEIEESSSSLTLGTDQTSFRWKFWPIAGAEPKKVSVYGNMRRYVEKHPIPDHILNPK